MEELWRVQTACTMQVWVHSVSTATVWYFVLLCYPTHHPVVSNILSASFIAPKHGTGIFIELSIMTLRSFFLRCDSWLRAHQCVSIAMAASPHVQQSAVSSSVSSTRSSNFMRSFLQLFAVASLVLWSGKKRLNEKKEIWERKMLFRIPLSWWCRKSITQLHLLIHQSYINRVLWIMLTALIMTRCKYLKDLLISYLECFCHHHSQIGMMGLGPFSSMQPDQLRYYFIWESWLHLFQPSRFSISIVHQRQRDVLLTMEKCKRRKVGENSSVFHCCFWVQCVCPRY